MARSAVSICNTAIARCGQSQFIQSLTENSAAGILCNQFYQDCLEQVLADHPWKFATRYRQLQLTGTPNSDYAYLYAYPNDCLFARQLYNDATIMSLTSNGIYIDSWDLYEVLPFIPIIPFTIIEDEAGGGLYLATDLDTPTLVYTARIANPNLFTPGFTSTLGWKITSEIAGPLTGKMEYAKAADDAYRKALSEAQARDLNEGHENDQRESELIIVRL